MWCCYWRAPGAESDEGSEASSDGENESPMGLGRSLRRQSFKDSDSSSSCSHMGSGPRLECSPFVNGDGEEGEVWSYFETSPPYSRVPLVDKVGTTNIYVLSCWKSNEQWQQFETLCAQESMQMNLWNSCYFSDPSFMDWMSLLGLPMSMQFFFSPGKS